MRGCLRAAAPARWLPTGSLLDRVRVDSAYEAGRGASRWNRSGAAAVEIHVLGEAWALGAQGERANLHGMKAALLAYLALKGPTERSELAELLWPDVSAKKARSNLRQTLKRLRELLGEECVESDKGPLRLRKGLLVDVLQLHTALESQDHARAASFDGELLQSMHFDDCPDLNGWLEGARRDLMNWQFGSQERHVLQQEAAGDLPAAIDGAKRLRRLDPRAEKAYQHLMRLYYLQGDRGAALEAYSQCQEMMLREFDSFPSEETRALARALKHAEAARQLPSPPVQPQLPLSIRHPPVLAGREQQWAAMEQAWAERQPMFVDGAAGMGKSRLVTEFASTRGRWLLLNARPGDQKNAFGTHMRSLSTVFKRVPGAHPRGWVRRELSRLIPDLEKGKSLPPIASLEERSRLFAAVIEFLRSALQEVDVLIFDDGQYMDQDSADLGIQVHAEFRSEMEAGRFPVIINAFRTSDVREEWERQLIQNVIASGLMRRIPVDRLDTAAVRAMLRGMGDPRLEGIAEEIAAYTGGNPLFIVETVRHLLRSKDFDGTFPTSLPLSERMKAIIEQRLQPLSKEAFKLVHVFATAQTDFSFRMAAEVLGVSVPQLEFLWRQLEEAELVRDRWFTHDVLGEVALSTLSGPEREELSARIDDYRRRHR